MNTVNPVLVEVTRGEVVESGPTAEIFDAPQTEYTRKLMAAAFNIAV